MNKETKHISILIISLFLFFFGGSLDETDEPLKKADIKLSEQK